MKLSASVSALAVILVAVFGVTHPAAGQLPGPALGSLGSTAASSAAPAATVGEQRTLVLLVNFTDHAVQPYTADFARDLVFSRVSAFFFENSYQQAWLTGDVVGWLTIPQSTAVCDMTALAGLAKEAATASGVDVAGYQRYVYAFPQNACTWWGWAVSGTPTQTFINGTLNLYVVAHEMGHNFGLRHSRSMHCADHPVGSVCEAAELGDAYDVMGSGTGHLNAYQKERLGWLASGQSPPVALVSSSGVYRIEPLETPTGGAKALKILKSTDPATAERIYYYIETRRSFGSDSGSAASPTLLSGVLIHTGSNVNGYKIDLRDMTVDTPYQNDHALTVGQTFTDTAAGVTITPLAVDETGASVSITIESGACTVAAPTLALSPAPPAAVAPGTAVPYVLSLTNNSAESCGAASFNLQTLVPAGWTATTAAQSLSVAAGGTASTTVTVTSAPNAAPGTYAWSAAAAAGSVSASTPATYVVAAPLTARVTTNSASYARGSIVTIAGTAARGTAPVTGAAVTFRIVPPAGKTTTARAVTDGSGAAFYQLRLAKNSPRGIYQVTASVSAAGQSASASTPFTVY